MKKTITILLLGLLTVSLGLEAKYSPLINAIKKKDMVLFNEAINKGANVNERIKDGVTPLILAATKNQVQMVQILLDKGADPLIDTKYGDTALMMASEGTTGDEMVRKLLIAVCGSAELLDKIVKSSKASLDQSSSTQITFTSEEETRRMKLKNYIDMKDDGRETALMIALNDRNEDAATLLIHAGANVTFKDEYGDDAAIIAEKKKLSGDIQLLIKLRKLQIKNSKN